MFGDFVRTLPKSSKPSIEAHCVAKNCIFSNAFTLMLWLQLSLNKGFLVCMQSSNK